MNAAGRFRSFLAQLRRRRVPRVVAVYVVAALALLQTADIMAPALHLPGWTMTLLVVLALIGLIVTALLAWAFDVVPGGPVIEAAAPDSPARAVVEPERERRPTIAVIPFLNLSPDPENDYFADGVTEDVIASLSKVRGLSVISRTSAMAFKARTQSLQAIAAALGANRIVDGSVRRSGDRVRIVAELIDAATDRHLWAETYDRSLTDIFAIQSDVAFRIASALRTELSLDEQTRIRQQPTDSIEAYELYLKGRVSLIRFERESMERAIRYFQAAIAVDPTFALAHANMAVAFAEMSDGGMIPPEQARARARAGVASALTLDPALSEAHTAAGYIKSIWDFDPAGAEAEYRRAIELSPSNADAYDFYGRLCGALGRFDEALALVRRAQELDPLTHRTDVASALIRAGHLEEAVAEAMRAVDQDPAHARAHATLAWALIRNGRTDEGIAALERAVALEPDNVQWLAQLGQAHATVGDEPAARAILSALETRAAQGFVSPYHLAFVHTGLGDHERALDLLEQAFREGTGAVHAIRGSFLFAPLRPHPRFNKLIERMYGNAAAPAP